MAPSISFVLPFRPSHPGYHSIRVDPATRLPRELLDMILRYAFPPKFDTEQTKRSLQVARLNRGWNISLTPLAYSNWTENSLDSWKQDSGFRLFLRTIVKNPRLAGLVRAVRFHFPIGHSIQTTGTPEELATIAAAYKRVGIHDLEAVAWGRTNFFQLRALMLLHLPNLIHMEAPGNGIYHLPSCMSRMNVCLWRLNSHLPRLKEIHIVGGAVEHIWCMFYLPGLNKLVLENTQFGASALQHRTSLPAAEDGTWPSIDYSAINELELRSPDIVDVDPVEVVSFLAAWKKVRRITVIDTGGSLLKTDLLDLLSDSVTVLWDGEKLESEELRQQIAEEAARDEAEEEDSEADE